MKHVVIIGNGISGTTCARYIRKQDSNVRITIISAETEHFFSRTALMYVYMGHMTYDNIKPYEDHFWEKNRIELVYKHVKEVDTDNKQLIYADNSTLAYDQCVLACGSKSNFFNWPGQHLKGVQSLYSFSDLQDMENNTTNVKHAVIVGGGLIGIEMAEMLRSRNIDVTFLVRENGFWRKILSEKEAKLIERHIAEHHIKLKLDSELQEIVGDTNSIVKEIVTKKGEVIPCQFVGITAGVSPNIDFLKGGKIETGKGVKVNRYFETNITDVYAIGDCAEFKDPPAGRSRLEQVWYTGRMHGQVLAQTLCGKRTEYAPGPWFNSAKFLDIEYQNYGMIPPDAKEGQEAFYWEDKTGKIAVRAHFEKDSNKFLGINTFGIRLRHELLDSWLSKGVKMDEVIELLADANFDPEFYRKYEKEIVAAYNLQYNKRIQLKNKSWSRILQNLKKTPHAGN